MDTPIFPSYPLYLYPGLSDRVAVNASGGRPVSPDASGPLVQQRLQTSRMIIDAELPATL